MALGAVTGAVDPAMRGLVDGGMLGIRGTWCHDRAPSIGRGVDDRIGTSWDQVSRHYSRPILSGKHIFILILHITKINKITILPSVFRRLLFLLPNFPGLLFLLPNFPIVLPSVVEGT